MRQNEAEQVAKAMIAEGGKFCAGHNTPSPETLKMFGQVTVKLDAIHNSLFGFENEGGIVQDIKEIKEQTKQTNGRVKKLEMWRFGIIMAGSVITFAVIPLMLYIYFDKVDKIQDKIDISVQQAVDISVKNALAEYNIIVK